MAPTNRWVGSWQWRIQGLLNADIPAAKRSAKIIENLIKKSSVIFVRIRG